MNNGTRTTESIVIGLLTLTMAARAAEPVEVATTPYARPPKEAWKVELLKQPLRAYCIDFNWLVDGNHVFFKAQIARDNHHVTSGFVGIPFLLTYLTENGMGDLAWRIATQPTYPGWFDMIFTLNNSVLKEDWAGKLVQMPSLAAPIGEWFYRCLGGIRPDAPGFKCFVIQPYTVTLDWVNCEHECPYGLIRSDWRRDGNTLTMEVTIPPNTTDTIHVPAKDADGVTESGKPAAKVDRVKFLRMENGAAVYEVGSGYYSFCSGK